MKKGVRFRVTYRLSGSRKQAYQCARDICYEQTVELPDELIPKEYIRKNVVGRVEVFKKRDAFFEAVISYPVKAAASELTQFLNVIFGNISLKGGIRLERFELPGSFIKNFPGPAFGVAGLRKIVKAYKRPLLCTALKPMGLLASEMGRLAYQFALNGIDIIKDDHGLTNQPYASFKERVSRCAEAIKKANKCTGFQSIYVANVTSGVSEFKKRALFAKKAGACGLMVAPGITGFDLMRSLACDSEIALPVFSHPAFSGSFVVSPESGISHYCLFGQLNRLAGSDVAIFPNYGGRFLFTAQDCADIARACSEKMGHIKRAFVSPGGGMSLDRVREMREFYGIDVIFLIGGGLMKGNLASNCRNLRRLMS